MKSKIPLIVAVAGALLIGGATTGTTRASWTSQAPLHSSSVTAGEMDFQVAGAPTAVSLASTSATSTHTLTVTDTSTSAATNLAQRITVTPDTIGPATATTKLGSCPSSTDLTHVDTQAGSAFQVCVTISATATGSVVIGFTGDQRRGASIGGWQVTHPVTIPVTVTVNAFGLRCDGSPSNNTVKLVWDSAGASVTYTHGHAASSAGPFTTDSGTTPTLTVNQGMTGSAGVRFYRISANTTPVKTTNILRVERVNSSIFNCSVTP